ncbi:MAG: hypothetical protein U1E26_03365 [Coriobacteriia bacterium]|nr:hypothetical protein [Coriobacteriia bacterium]
MSLKKIAAIIVASLVAGVVLGSFGIAGAGTGGEKLPGAMAPAPAFMADDCGSCQVEADAAATECGSGACATSANAPMVAAPSGAPAGGCPSTGCDSGECGTPPQ